MSSVTNLIDKINAEQARDTAEREGDEKNPVQALPEFRVGDTVRVHVKIREGDKERVQVFEGAVIGMKHRPSGGNFTVRKVSYGVGVERVFPLNSPRVEQVELKQRGRVRRSKLYYLRERRGRAARIKAKAHHQK